MPTKDEIVEAARLAQLKRFVPGVFAPGTLLYVGAWPRRSQFLPELQAAGRRVTILEIWPENADYFRGRPGLEVVCGDVREVATLKLPQEVYDVAFWWHGPEHVAKTDLSCTLVGLERRARTVVCGCPWGVSRQAELDGNIHQRHVSTLYPEDFQALGYRTDVYGPLNGGSRSNILAVKP